MNPQTMAPEELARQFVSVYSHGPGGCYGVRLAAPGSAPVVLGWTPNPAVVRERAEAVRRFVAAAIRAGRGVTPGEEVSEEFLTGLGEAATGGVEGRLVGLPG